MRWGVTVRLGLAAGLVLAAGRTASAEVLVAVNEGRVDLTARSAPLSEILDRLARQTKMQVTYEGAPPRHLVTAALQSTTPAQAVLSVMEGLGVNYALQLDPTGREVRTLMLFAAKTGAGGASARGAATPEPPAARVPPPPPPPDEDEEPPMADDDDPPIDPRPDRPGRMRPGRERPDRPGVFDPNIPAQGATPFPGPPVTTPNYPVSPFAPIPTTPTLPQPGQPPPPQPQPETDPDS